MAGDENSKPDTLDPNIIEVLNSLGKLLESTDKQVDELRDRVRRRHTIDQWMDENESEWYLLDRMCRSRPWATNKDKAFPYPFKKATLAMRKAGEQQWLGELEPTIERPEPPLRGETACEVGTNIVPTLEYPPIHRIFLFTPEFGADTSYSSDAWAKMEPHGKVDVWVVSWQGWKDFNVMLLEVFRWVESFGDGISTVWFGHSMGAIVMYEVLRLLQQREAPCIPVVAFVSGCPAPHIFCEAYDPLKSHTWLRKIKIKYDFEKISPEQTEVLQRDFSMCVEDEGADSMVARCGVEIFEENRKNNPKLSPGQRATVLSDLALMKTYTWRENLPCGSGRAVLVPLIAIGSDEDELVQEEHMKLWADYTNKDFEFLCLDDDNEDCESLGELGHGFARNPPKTLMDKVIQMSWRYQINKDIDDVNMLPDVGPTDGPLPEHVDVVVVGAGITGICAARDFVKQGLTVLIIDRGSVVGGVWKTFGNIYSRVNTSEVGYRIIDVEGEVNRPNQDHSPTHDIMRDMHAVIAKYCYGCVRLGWNLLKTERQPNDRWLCILQGVDGKRDVKIDCKFVMFAVNRRIGKRRDVNHKDQHLFRGEICYGYANELKHLNFWGKRVIVIGGGAFAFENMRTSVEHGARFCTMMARRAGTTCPKWIDMLAFMRPADENYMTGKAGNAISFEAWRKCYEDAGVRTPGCWDEGMLKPDNHTISVSDLVFIAGYHGLGDLCVGEIDRFRPDGHGVFLKDGTSLDCDIVIKCTGYHINEEVPEITGRSKMYPSGLLDFNMAYVAEPLLDGGQFGPLTGKGREDANSIKAASGTDDLLRENWHIISKLDPKQLRLMAPRGNPFGSGYAGTLLSQVGFIAWLAAHPEQQKQILEHVGEPRMNCVKYWASHMLLGQAEECKDLVAKALKQSE